MEEVYCVERFYYYLQGVERFYKVGETETEGRQIGLGNSQKTLFCENRW